MKKEENVGNQNLDFLQCFSKLSSCVVIKTQEYSQKKKKKKKKKNHEQTFDLPKAKAAFLLIATSSMNSNPLPQF